MRNELSEKHFGAQRHKSYFCCSKSRKYFNGPLIYNTCKLHLLAAKKRKPRVTNTKRFIHNSHRMSTNHDSH